MLGVTSEVFPEIKSGLPACSACVPDLEAILLFPNPAKLNAQIKRYGLLYFIILSLLSGLAADSINVRVIIGLTQAFAMRMTKVNVMY